MYNLLIRLRTENTSINSPEKHGLKKKKLTEQLQLAQSASVSTLGSMSHGKWSWKPVLAEGGGASSSKVKKIYYECGCAA